VFEIVSTFGLGELAEDAAAEVPELVDGPFRSVAEQLFE
jgi:hypothetical protein